jgi:hypothetical protein
LYTAIDPVGDDTEIEKVPAKSHNTCFFWLINILLYDLMPPKFEKLGDMEDKEFTVITLLLKSFIFFLLVNKKLS